MELRKKPTLEPIKSLGSAHPNAGNWLAPDEGTKAALDDLYKYYHEQLNFCINTKAPAGEEIEMLRRCIVYADAVLASQQKRAHEDGRGGHDILPDGAKNASFKSLQLHAQTLKVAFDCTKDSQTRFAYDAMAEPAFETSKHQFMNEGLIMAGVLADARAQLLNFQKQYANKTADAHSVTVAKYLHELYGTAIDYIEHIQNRFSASTVISPQALAEQPGFLVTNDRFMDKRRERDSDYKGSDAEKRAQDWRR